MVRSAQLGDYSPPGDLSAFCRLIVPRRGGVFLHGGVPMAGDWIQMRCDLADDPAVIEMAAAVNLEEDYIVGKLHRLWSWADRQVQDGNAPGVTAAWVDRYLSVPGFAAAMVSAGWLTVESDSVTFPKFDRYFSQSAKQRALTALRVAKHRAKGCSDSGVTKSLPEKKTVEKKREENKTEEGNNIRFVPPSLTDVNEYCTARGKGIDAEQFVDYYAARGWKYKTGQPMKDWKAAVRTWEKNQGQVGYGKPKPPSQLGGEI